MQVCACNHLQWYAVLSVKQLATLTHALMYYLSAWSCACHLPFATFESYVIVTFMTVEKAKMHYLCYSPVYFYISLLLPAVADRAFLLQHLTSLLCLASLATAKSVAIATLTMHKPSCLRQQQYSYSQWQLQTQLLPFVVGNDSISMGDNWNWGVIIRNCMPHMNNRMNAILIFHAFSPFEKGCNAVAWTRIE